jgi:hypothetical protein
LSFSFEWMDEDGDSLLSRRGVWRYFRSFLCSLLTLSGATLDIPMDEATKICDQCAVWTASKLFAATENFDAQSSVSFEDVADWYTSGGYQDATWLELLDLSKWLPLPVEEDSESVESSSNSSEDPTENIDPSDEDDESRSQSGEAFRVQLVGGKELRLTSQDAQFIKEISVASGLSKHWPVDIVRALYTCSSEGYVTRDGFEEFTLFLDFHPDVRITSI